jgi:hypothetical protein
MKNDRLLAGNKSPFNIAHHVPIAVKPLVIICLALLVCFGTGCQLNCRKDLDAEAEILRANGIDPKKYGLYSNDGVFKVLWNRITTGALLGDRIDFIRMDGEGLSVIPSSIGILTEVNRIDFSYNQLTTLPPEIGKLKKLRTLTIKGSNLKYLPEELAQCTSLVEIDLNTNELDSLPHGFGKLINLQKADLDNNRLKKLPPTIGGLKNMVRLDASYNQISELPSEIVGMRRLEVLNLNENKFVVCPSVCTTLAINGNLNRVSLGMNPVDTNTVPQIIREINPIHDYASDLLEINKLRIK